MYTYQGHKFFHFNFFCKKNKWSTIVYAYFVNRLRLEKLDKVFFAKLPNEMKQIYSLAKEPKLFRAMKKYKDSKPSLDCNEKKQCQNEIFGLFENAKKIVQRQHQVMVKTEERGNDEVDEGRSERYKESEAIVVKHEIIDLVSSSEDEKLSAKREAELSEDEHWDTPKKRKLDVEEFEAGPLHNNQAVSKEREKAVVSDRTEAGPSNFKLTRMKAADFFPASNLTDDEKENESDFFNTTVVESDWSYDGAETSFEERSSPNYDGDCEDQFDILTNQNKTFLKRFRKIELVTVSDYFADDSSDIDESCDYDNSGNSDDSNDSVDIDRSEL